MKYPVLVTLSVFSILFAGCNTQSRVLTPKTGPGTDYPCGVGGVVCGDSPPATNCCPPNCSCHPNACWFDGDPNTIPEWLPTYRKEDDKISTARQPEIAYAR